MVGWWRRAYHVDSEPRRPKPSLPDQQLAKDTFALHQPTRTSHQDAIEGALLRAGREPVNLIMREIGVVEEVQPARRD